MTKHITVVLAITLFLTGCGSTELEKAPRAMAHQADDSIRPAGGQVAQMCRVKASEHMFPVGSDAVGKVAYDEDVATPVFLPYTGRITRLLVAPRSVVKNGDPLFEIDTPDSVRAESDHLGALAAEHVKAAEAASQASGQRLMKIGFTATQVRSLEENHKLDRQLAVQSSLRDSVSTSINQDVDSAYAVVEGVRAVLQPYRDRYLAQAAEIRDTVSFSYSRGAASLLEFLDTQRSYRDIQLTYRNLAAGYWSAVNQLNLAVGKDVTK